MSKKLFAAPKRGWKPQVAPSDLLQESKPVQIDTEDWEAFLAAQEGLRTLSQVEPAAAIEAAREAEAFGVLMDTAWLPEGGWDTVATALLDSEIARICQEPASSDVFGTDAGAMLKAAWEKAVPRG